MRAREQHMPEQGGRMRHVYARVRITSQPNHFRPPPAPVPGDCWWTKLCTASVLSDPRVFSRRCPRLEPATVQLPTLRLPKFNVEWWPAGWWDRNFFVSSLAAPPVPRAGRRPWSILTLEGGRRVARRGADRFFCIWAADDLAVQSFVHQPLRSCRFVVRFGLGSGSIALHAQ